MAPTKTWIADLTITGAALSAGLANAISVPTDIAGIELTGLRRPTTRRSTRRTSARRSPTLGSR